MGTRENIWNEVVPGTRSFLSTSTAQERDFLSENDLVPERAYEFQSGIFSDIGKSTVNFPVIFRLESLEL